jgi:hypothetical protein
MPCGESCVASSQRWLNSRNSIGITMTFLLWLTALLGIGCHSTKNIRNLDLDLGGLEIEWYEEEHPIVITNVIISPRLMPRTRVDK